jgi:hypothetical protein
MSLKASGWAMDQRLSTHQKMVLLVLADCHNGETGQCNPRRQTIIERGGMSRTAFARAMEILLETGLVSRERDRWNVFHYTLHFDVMVVAKPDGRAGNIKNIDTPKAQSCAFDPKAQSCAVAKAQSWADPKAQSCAFPLHEPEVEPEVEPEAQIIINQGSQVFEQSNPKIQNTTKNQVTFDAFWAMWPKRVDKKKAQAAWRKVGNKQETLALIAANLEMQANAGNWNAEPQFIPYPATYINGERWNDTVTPRAETKPKHRTTEDTLNNPYF